MGHPVQITSLKLQAPSLSQAGIWHYGQAVSLAFHAGSSHSWTSKGHLSKADPSAVSQWKQAGMVSSRFHQEQCVQIAVGASSLDGDESRTGPTSSHGARGA